MCLLLIKTRDPSSIPSGCILFNYSLELQPKGPMFESLCITLFLIIWFTKCHHKFGQENLGSNPVASAFYFFMCLPFQQTVPMFEPLGRHFIFFNLIFVRDLGIPHPWTRIQVWSPSFSLFSFNFIIRFPLMTRVWTPISLPSFLFF